MLNLPKNIKEIKSSIVAIGFQPTSNQITIIGSGFSISDDGKILSCAHLLKNLTPEQIETLKADVMVEQKENDFERYQWIPIHLVSKNDADDLAIFQLSSYRDTLLKKVALADSEKVELGQDVYFLGFPYAAQLINDGFGITLVANRGIVSNIKRDGADTNHKRNWLIVDAISNPGNSGCPLISVETNEVIGVMTISFRTPSRVLPNLDIREPMHIAGAKPINLAKELLT